MRRCVDLFVILNVTNKSTHHLIVLFMVMKVLRCSSFFGMCQRTNVSSKRHSALKIIIDSLQWFSLHCYRTALHYAASWGCIKTLNILLRCPGIDVNKQDYHGKTPLYKVCQWSLAFVFSPGINFWMSITYIEKKLFLRFMEEGRIKI